MACSFYVMSNQEMYHAIVAYAEPLTCQRQLAGFLLLGRFYTLDLPPLPIHLYPNAVSSPLPPL